MPTGDIPGWHQVFADNFSTYSVPLGGFSGCSSATRTCSGLTGTALNNWWGYPDGWSNYIQSGVSYALYNETKTVSIQNGVMTMHLHQENGTTLVAAPLPKIPGATGVEGGLPNGRYSFRFRGDNVAHYGTAFLLWPDSETWPRDGEVDYPEGHLNGGFCAYLHHQGATSGSDQEAFCPAGVTYTTWHTATFDKLPGSITFYLDGKNIGSSTTNVPNTPMHWVFQTLAYEAADAMTAGNVQIDWFTAYTPATTTTTPPTNTPVASPTNTPVVGPTNTPVVGPTNTPVAGPTNTPVANPTNTVIPTGTGKINNVFVIVEENHNWSSFKGSSSAPYINNTLLPMASHAEQYYNPPNNHPSLGNYLWLESGQCFNYCGTDNDPSASPNGLSGGALHSQLSAAGISWKGYFEGIADGSCPMSAANGYTQHHDPFVYYNDVTSNPQCPNLRSYADLGGDLANNTVARYNFIVPNECNDGHNTCAPDNDPVKQTDDWLKANVPTIMNSSAYKNGGALFITWDEGSGSDGPIGMIIVSPSGKGSGYSNTIHYTHGSTLRTMEEIFGVSPFLGDAQNQTDLSDLFTTFP